MAITWDSIFLYIVFTLSHMATIIYMIYGIFFHIMNWYEMQQTEEHTGCKLIFQ